MCACVCSSSYMLVFLCVAMCVYVCMFLSLCVFVYGCGFLCLCMIWHNGKFFNIVLSLNSISSNYYFDLVKTTCIVSFINLTPQKFPLLCFFSFMRFCLQQFMEFYILLLFVVLKVSNVNKFPCRKLKHENTIWSLKILTGAWKY